MRARFFAIPTTTAAIVCAAVFAVPAAASTSAARTSGTDGWGHALEVPGIAALNTGDQAGGNAISCPSAGDCLAGGNYLAKGSTLPYVVSETHGTWGHATKVATPFSSSYASVDAVSCPSAGNCAIALTTTTTPLVASEVNGTWHEAEPILGESRSSGIVTALSCSAPGNCTVGGISGSDNTTPMFLANEVNGVWQKAIGVPGVPLAIQQLDALSCASPGNCTASGFFKMYNSETNGVPFVVDEVHGAWHKAIQVPGTYAWPYGEATKVSCATAGNCSVAGAVQDQNWNSQAFVANEVNGVWGKAIVVARALNTASGGQVDGISCPTAGNCTATGTYAVAAANRPVETFVASEVNGTWQQAQALPGVVALSKDSDAESRSISCFSPGNCAVGGLYMTSNSAPTSGFVADEVNGIWHTAFAAPGLAALSHGTDSRVQQISCGALGNCSAVGTYGIPGKPASDSQVFVISRS